VSARADAVMGTVVTIDVHGAGADDAIERALGWFHHVEACCSRFEDGSELRRLSVQVGVPVAVSPVLFEAVRFALHVAEATAGAFDPTVGAAMMRRGFDREHRTGRRVAMTPDAAGGDATYVDVELDEARRTITLRRPLVLDLGAVAKGLAIDLAARELEPFVDFSVYAGGDLFVGGRNADDEPWSIGIRHPRRPGALIASVRVSNRAVCTSGDYEQTVDGAPGEHHILDARSGASPSLVASATVIAPTAMAADALATAAFVLGPRHGLALLERMQVEGFIVGADLACHATPGFPA
jgi:thiamine biosynthesis lipoprotein